MVCPLQVPKDERNPKPFPDNDRKTGMLHARPSISQPRLLSGGPFTSPLILQRNLPHRQDQLQKKRPAAFFKDFPIAGQE